jgi:hypothetical protein
MLSFRQILILLVAIAYSSQHETIDYRDILQKLGEFNLEHKVACYQNFIKGDCEGLEPTATACVWPPHAEHGYCAYKDENGKYANNFKLAIGNK